MIVGRYMHSDPVTVKADAPLAEAKRVMEENAFGLLLVVSDDGKLRGFITRGSLKGATDWEAPVGKVCFEARFGVSPTDTVEKAALILLENRLVLLPVVEEERLIGVITQSEILRALADGLGIGLKGTRLTVRVGSDDGDLHRILAVLHKNGVHLVSMAQRPKDEAQREVILRVQGIADKEALRSELEEALRSD
ncbi:MAG TPA: CBS domain-containing protein [Candidatus Heimdallarchaeota archaeon]|nr:CBS domain-containing protein [Candidatus Heimdallarchaeota archaeon]